MPRTHDWTVIGYYEDNGEAYSELVTAENSLTAAGKAAKLAGESGLNRNTFELLRGRSALKLGES